MKLPNRDSKLLASLAVFRELADKEKDVYGIISVFLSHIISSEALHSFSLNEITTKLNQTFEFDIPDAVVRTSLGRLAYISREKTNYFVDSSKVEKDELDVKQTEIISNNEFIIQKLLKFIEKEKSTELTEKEKQKIYHSFCNFLLEESNTNNDSYIEYITAFILENEADFDFRRQLNLIREGVILYSGIKYNSNLNDLGTWRTQFTIYIETEILFYLAGYNGELYQKMVLDFLAFVREINDKSNNRLIHLKYFKEVKKEIDRFFSKAIDIVDGKEKPNPDGSAMLSIISGCKTRSDVISKESDFYTLLFSKAIKEDDYQDYFLPENHKFNIVNQEVDLIASSEFETNTTVKIDFLNYISILRKNSNQKNFENVGYVLLSGNRTSLSLATKDYLIDKGQVPLATTLSFLTNKFWFKLNKGFGKGNLPKTFDVITKAQIVFSKVYDKSISEKYNEFLNEYKKGNLTEDQAKARIVNLRGKARRPEEFRSEVVKDALNIITEDSLEHFAEEQKHQKLTAESRKKENLELKAKLEQNGNQLLETKQKVLNKALNEKNRLEDNKFLSDSESVTQYRNFKLLISLFVVVPILYICYRAYNDWANFELWTFIILVAIPIILYYLYMIWVEKEWSPLQQLKNRKEAIFKKNYAKFNFDTEKLHLIENEITELRLEIEKIEEELI